MADPSFRVLCVRGDHFVVGFLHLESAAPSATKVFRIPGKSKQRGLRNEKVLVEGVLSGGSLKYHMSSESSGSTPDSVAPHWGWGRCAGTPSPAESLRTPADS